MMGDGRVQVKVLRLDPDLPMPVRAHSSDAGFDLLAGADVSLKPGERALIPTGLAVAIPDGYAGYVQPRSGLAARHGLGLLNSPGLIDPGYRGEIKLIAINLDPYEPLHLSRGDRVAQLVILPVPAVDLVEVSELPGSARGDGGFGSTGQ